MRRPVRRYAEGAFHDQHRGEQFPGAGVDLPADDACVEEVPSLWMTTRNPSEENATCGECAMLTMTITEFEIRLPTTGRRPARKVTTIIVLVSGRDTKERQDTDQVDRREEGIERRDAYLREDDAAEGFAQPEDAFGQRAGERRAFGIAQRVAQRDHGADDHADQYLRKRVAGPLPIDCSSEACSRNH